MWDFCIASMTLFLYYAYFFRESDTFFFREPRPSNAPPGPRPIPRPKPTPVNVRSDSNGRLAVLADGTIWTIDLPEPYALRDGRIVEKDVCDGSPDGSRVPARGQVLHDYIRSHGGIVAEDASTEASSSVDVAMTTGEISALGPLRQNEDVYYFRCKRGRVDGLFSCRQHDAFRDGECLPVGPCKSGKEPPFADPFDRRFYFECDERRRAVRKQCPPRTFFVHDSCRATDDLTEYCATHRGKYLQIDAVSYVECTASGRAKLRSCPRNTKFSAGRCVSDACSGKKKGERIALPAETFPPFVYSPGFVECGEEELVSRTVRCPSEWDRHLAPGEEDVSSLPLVFDVGTDDCEMPRLCENVQTSNSLDVVPRRHFSKHVREWKRSEMFDALVGYRCNAQGQKKRLPALPGQIVKRHRFESACDNPAQRHVPVAAQTSFKYFDCDQKTVKYCPAADFFNGSECQTPSVSDRTRYHLFEDVPVFRFDGLSDIDDWIVPWDYVPKTVLVNSPRGPCVAPESHDLLGFNVCAHPDCAPFSHVLHLEEGKGFAITRDGHVCKSEGGKLKKSSEPVFRDGFDFWNQRGTPLPDGRSGPPPRPKPLTECTFGERIRSGFFYLDSTVYATCDSVQPFVFCPSARTDGIVKVQTKGKVAYACNPPKESILPENVQVQFKKNELEKIERREDDTFAYVDNSSIPIEVFANGLRFDGNSVTLKVTKPVRLVYQLRATLPPTAYFEKGRGFRVDNDQNTFLFKSNSHTPKPMKIPKFSLAESVPDYYWTTP